MRRRNFANPTSGAQKLATGLSWKRRIHAAHETGERNAGINLTAAMPLPKDRLHRRLSRGPDTDPQRCGWLYGLYKPDNDPKTGKTLDATKPAGEWNHMRIVISPDKCIHEVNGVKYFEYVIGSEDFNKRVAASKFGKMPDFAKSGSGYLALQGDHGQVQFRNVKIRAVK